MPSPAVERLLLRIAEADTTADAELALRELAALDDADPAVVVEHPPVGDLYSRVAGRQFEAGEVDEAIRLQAAALEHPCTKRRFEQGTLLGYRFVGREDAAALTELKASRSGGRSDALLLSGFAAQVEGLELGLALRLHDEALEVAKAAKPVDEALVAEVSVGRALARSAAGFDTDEDDAVAEVEIAEVRRAVDLGDAREARQLFIPRDQLDAARAAWPDLIDLADADAYYATLERRWSQRPADAPALQPYPVDVALFTAAGVQPPRLLDDLPPDLVLAIEASGAGPVAWPPGRNDPCWCGSGLKYKRCDG
ncbi:MAG: SEC-C domain-containing protein [Solirubrobacteraceae bacterium]|nr:SEC-C domain-containing protein [Patulibacter sp.]